MLSKNGLVVPTTSVNLQIWTQDSLKKELAAP